MGKKKTKADESQNVKSQTQSGIFSGNVAEGSESSGLSSLFSDGNPFRRKKHVETNENEPNVDNDEEEVTVPLVNAKDVEKETNLEVVEIGLESKRKKKKRDEIENEYEYETKKYGNVEMKEEKKVGEKRKRAEEEVADTMVTRESFLELFSLGTCL
ncbi:unnamed protein product [Brassica rapa subsp. narinosa]